MLVHSGLEVPPRRLHALRRLVVLRLAHVFFGLRTIHLPCLLRGHQRGADALARPAIEGTALQKECPPSYVKLAEILSQPRSRTCVSVKSSAENLESGAATPAITDPAGAEPPA